MLYRIMSMKAAATDPMWNPSIAGRELLKPKFYDVWLDVSGKNLAVVTNSTVKGKVGGSNEPLIDSSRALREDGQPVKARSKDSKDSAMVEMQRLMLVEIQVSTCSTCPSFSIQMLFLSSLTFRLLSLIVHSCSPWKYRISLLTSILFSENCDCRHQRKGGEAMKYRAEWMMQLLTQHIEHVENRLNSIDEGRNPQLQLLERVNLKLEKVLDGFAVLNQHLSMLIWELLMSSSMDPSTVSQVNTSKTLIKDASEVPSLIF